MQGNPSRQRRNKLNAKLGFTSDFLRLHGIQRLYKQHCHCQL